MRSCTDETESNVPLTNNSEALSRLALTYAYEYLLVLVPHRNNGLISCQTLCSEFRISLIKVLLIL